MVNTSKPFRKKTGKPHSHRVLFMQAVAAGLTMSLMMASPAWAVGTVLSGIFDGSEPRLLPIAVMPLEDIDCTEGFKGYLQTEFQVSESGTYRFKNAFGQTTFNNPVPAGVGVTAHVYEQEFDAAAPDKNLVASAVFNWLSKRITLTSGAPYVLVVQQWCSNRDGAWAVTFTGPGSIDSEFTRETPSFTSGRINPDDPSTLNPCLSWWDIYESRYEQFGPVRVSRDGLYYFSDAGQSELCLSIFTAPFNPDNWSANYITSIADGFGPLRLNAGQDYYFLAQLGSDTGMGEYYFVLAPPAPFRINPGLSDSWYQPDTPGQGFFLDVMDQRNQIFLGWFNFNEEASAFDTFNHRWLTAFGPFSGTSADLAIEWSSGGAFDTAQPVPTQHHEGSIRLEFTDCNHGWIEFSWDGLGGTNPSQSGVIPIERITGDSIALCESLYREPGLPGAL